MPHTSYRGVPDSGAGDGPGGEDIGDGRYRWCPKIGKKERAGSSLPAQVPRKEIVLHVLIHTIPCGGGR